MMGSSGELHALARGKSMREKPGWKKRKQHSEDRCTGPPKNNDSEMHSLLWVDNTGSLHDECSACGVLLSWWSAGHMPQRGPSKAISGHPVLKWAARFQRQRAVLHFFFLSPCRTKCPGYQISIGTWCPNNAKTVGHQTCRKQNPKLWTKQEKFKFTRLTISPGTAAIKRLLIMNLLSVQL